MQSQVRGMVRGILKFPSISARGRGLSGNCKPQANARGRRRAPGSVYKHEVRIRLGSGHGEAGFGSV